MKIETKHLPSEGISLTFEVGAREFSVLNEMMDNAECAFDHPIQIQVEAAPEHDLIKVKGTLSTIVGLSCSRCLADFQEPLRRRFTLRFSNAIASDIGPAGADEIELSAEQMDLMPFDGEVIDLREAIQEQVILALPFKPLCKEDCKGLCPRCGADLNAAPCQCEVDTKTNPFAELKGRHWPAR
ncbi:MAG: DUF177 domain-containing protein [Desulfobacteraceae bacterium]|nr:DUF177 domain-containing protein [Desulfobacteraceae bacterium]